ncbi:MAG: hypothetical protein PSY14_04655 [bacterium]|nr:hypothetical protein [bacterium]
MQQQLKPLLMLVALVLIAGGAALALCFGYAAWQVLYHPEKVDTLTYILGNMAQQKDVPAMTMMVDGRVGEYRISAPMKMFGLAYLFIAGLAMLVSIARCLSDAGVSILKAIWLPPAPTRKPQPPQATPQKKPEVAL